MCALESEASGCLTGTYHPEDLSIIVTGVGMANMYKATRKVILNMTPQDTIINIGICGASSAYNIGEIIDCYIHKITCVSRVEKAPSRYQLVDMESEGFQLATEKINNKFMFKVVSDHFEPGLLSVEYIKGLISSTFPKIYNSIITQNKNKRTFTYELNK